MRVPRLLGAARFLGFALAFALVLVLVLALALVLVLVFVFVLGVTRSGSSFFPVERFHSSYVWSVILPLTSSSANLRRWALLLNGIGVTRACRRRPWPFRRGSCWRARWRGVSVDALLEHAELQPTAQIVTALCYGGYTTNVPLPDLVNGQAFVAYEYDGKPLPADHGGPARLVVPHLYFWKSAKWVRGLKVMTDDRPGFWESLGYNNHGDPWKEERYSGDS